MTKVASSGALNFVSFGQIPCCTFCGSAREALNESTTSAEVTGDPSENFSPLRRWKVNFFESGEASHDSAAAPSRPDASILLRTSERLTSGHAQIVGLLLW
jgi:hypothetical protein